MTAQPQPTMDALIRRQLVVAALAAAVVLASVLVVAWAVPDGDAGHAVLRLAPDGSRVVTASPVAESSRFAIWVAVGALLAVSGVLVLLVHHTVRVARCALRREMR